MDATLLESRYGQPYEKPFLATLAVLRKNGRVLVAFLLLLVSLPLFLLLALAIKLTSPGPVFYRRLEMAEDETLYYAYEFRTTFNAPHHNRLTAVGTLLKNACLNQLPRLINVVEGNARFNLRLLDSSYS